MNHALGLALVALTFASTSAWAAPPDNLDLVHGTVIVASGETLAPSPGRRLEIIGPETGPAVLLMPGATLLDVKVTGRDASLLGAAVLVRGGRARIERCAISGGPGDGILILRGEAVVSSCMVTSSRSGIAARNSDVYLESTVIAWNAEVGLDLEESSWCEMRACVISANGAEGVRLGARVIYSAESTAITQHPAGSIRHLFLDAHVTMSGVFTDERGIESTPATIPSSSPGAPTGILSAPRPSPFLSELITPLLAEIDFREIDLRVPMDRMPFTPPAVKSALEAPLRLPAAISSAAEGYSRETTPAGFLRALAGALDSDLIAHRETLETPLALDDALEQAALLCDALPSPDGLAEAAWKDDPPLTLLEEHLEEPANQRASTRLGERAETFSISHLNSLCRAASTFASAAIEEAHDVANGRVIRPFSPPSFTCTGLLRAAWPTPRGWIVVGDTGPNEYGPEAAVIIDLGGDDLYRDCGNAESRACVVVDLAGADRYEGRTAAARRGIAIVIDLAGSDVYSAGDFSLGAAQGGVALLWDESGDDRYEAGRAAEGFAVAGRGGLVDRSGHDDYIAGSYAQAASGPSGAGILLDESGNDRYLLTGGADDILRDPSQRVSFGQGFSTGYRPGSAGGVALLIDGGGNDIYTASLFAQGCAYWGALAAIYDADGDDAYSAWRYAQGAGVHIAYGALIDRAGRDVYQSYSVSQGCGHDLSIGLLMDDAGNDLYRSDNLSQGAGSLNGTGLLVDRGGQDAYILEGHSLGQGWGVMENVLRRFGSLGLFLDLGGDRDVYTEAGRDGTTWRQGEIGIGVDK